MLSARNAMTPPVSIITNSTTIRARCFSENATTAFMIASFQSPESEEYPGAPAAASRIAVWRAVAVTTALSRKSLPRT
jgi:hypothetical protein